MQRGGVQNAQYLWNVIFPIEDDTDGDLLSIFGEVCDGIETTLDNRGGVLIWDIGGGVAAMAAYSK